MFSYVANGDRFIIVFSYGVDCCPTQVEKWIRNGCGCLLNTDTNIDSAWLSMVGQGRGNAVLCAGVDVCSTEVYLCIHCSS